MSKFSDLTKRKTADAPEAEQPSESVQGRPRNPNSLRQQLERGEAKQLKLIVPSELHRRLKIQAAMQERDISEIAAEVLGRYLDEQDEPSNRK